MQLGTTRGQKRAQRGFHSAQGHLLTVSVWHGAPAEPQHEVVGCAEKVQWSHSPGQESEDAAVPPAQG